MAGKRRSNRIANAAMSGDRRRLLVSTRSLIAETLDSGEVSPRDMASLSKRLMDIAREIEEIDALNKRESDPIGQAIHTGDEPLG